MALLDMELTIEPECHLDPRPHLKILRLLLTGGLMDPERDGRHRKKPGKVKCQCGGAPSHDHISWHCPQFRDLRMPAMVRALPVCFKRTTVVPVTSAITQTSVQAIQAAVVNIWQQRIKEWHSAEVLRSVLVT